MGGLYILATTCYGLGLIFYFQQRKHIKKNHILLLVFGFTAIFGYAAGVFAAQIETYLFCEMMYTLSMLLSLMYMVLSVGDLCQIPVKKAIQNSLFAAIILLLLMQCDPFSLCLYRRSVKLVTVNGFSYAETEYGPGYYLKTAYILACFFIVLKTIISAMKTKKQISKRTCWYLIMICFSVFGCYILKMLTGSIYNFIPLCLPVVQIFIILVIRKMSLYDINETFASLFEERKQYCFICFDGKKRYMGCSRLCMEMFPGLDRIRVDQEITEEVYPELLPIVEHLEDWRKDPHEHIVDVEGEKERTLSCKSQTIIVHGRIIGQLIEMNDITKSQKEKNRLNANNMLLNAALEKQSEKIRRIQESIITGMARMVESRDNSTGGHINRTSAGVRCFIEYIHANYSFPWCTPDFCVKLIEAAPLHDLGKIAVDDQILKKKEKFTEAEFAEMKKHAEEGAKIVPVVLGEVEDEEFKKLAENIAHYHHEHWDGKGYPCGLKGEEIPVEARIMAFADVFDALVSRRCYKDAFSYENAFEIIRDSLGTQFDPGLGKIFLECRPEIEEIYNKFDLK